MNAWQIGQQKFMEPIVLFSHLYVELFRSGTQIPDGFSEILVKTTISALLFVAPILIPG